MILFNLDKLQMEFLFSPQQLLRIISRIITSNGEGQLKAFDQVWQLKVQAECVQYNTEEHCIKEEHMIGPEIKIQKFLWVPSCSLLTNLPASRDENYLDIWDEAFDKFS